MSIEEKPLVGPAIRFSISGALKKILFFFLIFLPFQSFPKTLFPSGNNLLLNVINYSDEIVFLLSLAIALSFLLIRPSSYPLVRFPGDKFIGLFFFSGFTSLLINRVPLGQGFFGIYDVLKNIFVIYLFSTLHYSKEEFSKIVVGLSGLAFFLAAVGIAGEVLAAVFGLGIGTFVFETKRLGLYRIISLVGRGNWNYFGIYLVLFLFLGTVVAENKNKLKKAVYRLTLLVSIFLTVSRQAWVGLGVVLIAMNKKLISVAIILFAAISLSFLGDSSQYSPDVYYRSFTLKESLKIFGQNPLLGAGPGMFGGVASVLFASPYYEAWPEFYRSMILKTRNIDMFWPWLIAEFGLIGALLYISIWVAIFFQLKKASRFFTAQHEPQLARVGRVLQYFILALAVMGMAGGLNAAFVAFTYFALCGVYLSVHRRYQYEDSPRQ